MNHPDHVLANREVWTRYSVEYVEPGHRNWSTNEITWGIWSIPEAQIGALSGIDFEGKSTIELGCGTAYFSSWLARRGALPTGVDITPAQLDSARTFQQEFGIEFPLIEANAEDTRLEAEGFDFALSEYGASIWCDPYRWIPEAARLLKPGGHLVFLRNTNLSVLCMPEIGAVTTTLQRNLRSLRRLQWDDGGTSVEFQLPNSDLVKLLVDSGFVIENLIDLWPREDAEETRFEYMTLDWAQQWPSEEIWRVRKA